MKALAYLNPYFWKYRGRLFLGFVFIALTNVFNVYAPELIGQSIDFVHQILSNQTAWQNGNVEIPVPDAMRYMEPITHWGENITLNSGNIGHWAWVVGFTLGLGYLIVFLIKGVFLFYQRQSLIVMSRHMEFDLKNEIYNKYQELDSTFYKQNRTGDLMNRISEDVNRVRMYLGPAVMYTINLVVLLVMCSVVMWNINPKLTLFTLGPLPIMMIGIFYVSTIINRRTEKLQKQQSKLSTIVQEAFSGIRVVKTFHRETYFSNQFQEESNEYKSRQIELVKTDALFMPVISILVGMSTILTIYIGASEVENGNASYGTIVQFVFYVNQLTWPFASVGWVTSLVRKAEASQSRINAFLQTEPLITRQHSQHSITQGNLEFKQVSYTYPETGIVALKNISLIIPSGKRIGITGKTGSGKSTLAQLIGRMYDPKEGVVLLDSIPLQEYDLFEVRKQLGYVPQEVFLFSDTIRNNIAFGVDNPTEAAIIQAATDAGIHQDILGFKDGYETILGERGINLSGGQKQRVSIARALLLKPKVLILDDCLSAVDTATEDHILRSLWNQDHQATMILISHRVSAIQNCEEIVVMDEGRIIEQGNHASLLEANGHYARIYRLQQEEQQHPEL
jgi:ATP-binding cassette subfamily B multidrug efflux pump